MSAAARQSKGVPQSREMCWPVLQALVEIGGSGRIREIDERVAVIAGYDEEMQSILHQGGPQTEIAYRLAWARTKLKGLRAVENSSHGVWSITDHGRSLREGDLGKQGHRNGGGDDGTVFDNWRVELLTVIQHVRPDRFEHLCRRILLESGFIQVEVTGRSGDGG